jgi:OTU domain-containing protein 3
MEEVVLKSLPFIADRETVRKMLEEAKGNIDSAVSKLLDADERASISSSSNSSKRHLESDNEEETSLDRRKRRDRRQSSATKIGSQKAREAATRAARQIDEESVKVDDSDVDLLVSIPDDTKVTFAPTGRSVSPTALSQTSTQLELPSQSSGAISDDESSIASSAPPSQSTRTPAAKPQARPVRETARVRRERKKLAQKAAAKERKLLAAAVSNASSKSGNSKRNKAETQLKPVSGNSRQPSGTGIEHGIKTLYI